MYGQKEPVESEDDEEEETESDDQMQPEDAVDGMTTGRLSVDKSLEDMRRQLNNDLEKRKLYLMEVHV
jgi:hypothetical protein